MNPYSAAADLSRESETSSPGNSQLKRYVQFGNFHFDIERRELFKNGLRARVQSKVCEALLILVETPGQLITREVLRARLWPGNTAINHDANVNTTVNKLRLVLGDSHDQPSYIETIPRTGYKFIANAQFVERPQFAESWRQNGFATVKSAEAVGTAPKNIFGLLKESWWFAAGLTSLLVGALLFGAAVVLFAHRVQ